MNDPYIDHVMNDDYFTKSDFKQYKKERKNKLPRNIKTEERESQKPKNMRLSVMGKKIGENRAKIADMIARFEILRIQVEELMSLFPTESDETEVKEIEEVSLEPEDAFDLKVQEYRDNKEKRKKTETKEE